ncbi:molybdopterin-guanine dinucleotide biosynthesis protein B [Sulfuracidifex tepidarius]|uniref:Molybdopterin-guanine dinucleotide biosynthesis protein B (MobB) domain-containing protein n=1 Tax=Sulfuracidifex tepidarius TaxID=1294262 RepID=A0A510E2X8_9CREN|nr:molybdopterin-guanine dinucleotide biosynthesis protein B [Sulfuracidifex tepidarius]BBG24091.1 hypothetical protein IC006_1392 [Sulfuracidifex tepidarius]BBG26846.1 hypothetical protein IC007_1367 [Sulfuracidifex tepidarius]
MNCIFQIAGLKDTGKTSVIESVLNKVKRNNEKIKIAVIKKSHHVVDPEGKDTWRFRKAGAHVVLFYGGDNVTSILIEENPLDFLDLLPSDAVLIEGFNQEEIGEKFIITSPEEVENLSSVISSKIEECYTIKRIVVDGDTREVRENSNLWLMYNLMKKLGVKEVKLKC